MLSNKTFIILFKSSSKLTLLVILLMLSLQGQAFKTTGHFIVARIAEREIQGLPFYNQILDILRLTGQFTKEKNHPFVECAPWADDIKYIDLDMMDKWHFETTYNDGKRVIPVKDYPKLGLEKTSVDIVWAINQAKKTLRNTRVSAADDRLGKGIMMRMLIHLIGDIHQPLHNSPLVNAQFPKGDLGGNKFVIDMPGARDLHSYWDMCLKKYPIMKHPLSDRNFNRLNDITDAIMHEYPRNKPEIAKRLKKKGVRDWSNESVQLTIKHVYKGIQPTEKPSKSYIEENQKIIDEQLAIAGYRLTDTLIHLFSDPEVLQPHVKGQIKAFAREAVKGHLLRAEIPGVEQSSLEDNESIEMSENKESSWEDESVVDRITKYMGDTRTENHIIYMIGVLSCLSLIFL